MCQSQMIVKNKNSVVVDKGKTMWWGKPGKINKVDEILFES